MNLSAVFTDKLADEHSDIEDDGDFTNYWNRGVIGIATNGWRVLSKSADLDYHIFSRFRFTLNRILYHNLKDLV